MKNTYCTQFILKKFFFFTLLCFSSSLYAHKEICPSLKTLQGWAIYAGKLGDTTYEQAPISLENKNFSTQVWEFDNKHSYWIACTYKHHFTLHRAIPSNIKKCFHIFKIDKKHNAINKGIYKCN